MPLESPDLTEMTTASPSLVNYDFTDVANGTGYEDYYLIESEAGSKDYHLTPKNDYSNSAFIQVTSGTSDLDYDLSPFVIPRTINGDVLISMPVWRASSGAMDVVFKLYRWDGSTETQIGSTVTFNETVSTTSKMIYVTMTISNTIIPAGESLRLNVLVANATATAERYGIDPAGRTDADLDITTTSKISIPYKLDV